MQSVQRRITNSSRISLVIASLSIAPFTYAQTALEEVVVTATKRETTVQEIPMSIEVVAGDDLQARGIVRLEELATAVPNLEVGDGLLTTGVAIRGLGSQPERSIEQSVGMFIDGVYMPRSRQYRSPFLDVERVEVLRGPQAVLFGLNSTAGAISIITRKNRPGDPFIAEFTGAYEFEHGGPTFTGVIGGSPSEDFGLRVVAKYADRDGYFTNDFDGSEHHASDEQILRATMVVNASDTLTLTAKGEFGKFEFDGSVGEQLGDPALNQLVASGFPAELVTDDLTLDWRHNMDETFIPIMIRQANHQAGGLDGSGIVQKYDNVSLTIDWEVGDQLLTGLIARSNADWDLYTDLDGTFLPILDAGINEGFEQDSIEVRLTSPGNQKIDYILGFYSHKNELTNEQPNVLDPTFALAPGAFGFEQNWTSTIQGTDDELWSLFGTATWNISDAFRLTGGVRYVDQEKKHVRDGVCAPINGGVADFSPEAALFDLEAIVGAGTFFCPNLLGFTDTFKSDNVLPELAAQWDLGENVMVFGKYGESVKAGGYAFSTIIDGIRIEYQDEEAENVELGIKTSLAGGAATLNVTLYRTEFTNLQVNTFDPVTAAASIQNAAEATSQGVELDAAWQATEWLQLYASLALLDNEFDSFPDAPCPISDQLAGVPAPCDATGSPLPFAPETSGTFGLDITAPIGAELYFVAGAAVGFKDDYIVDAGLERAFDQDSYTTVNLNLGIEAQDGRWGLSLIGRNLSDEAIRNNATPFFTNLAFLKEPRTISLQGRYRVGGE